MRWWQSWHYKNLTFLVFGLLVPLVLSNTPGFKEILFGFGNLAYLAAFLVGVSFVSTFTVATGGLVLLILAEKLSLLPLGIIACAGALIGDMLIFRYVKSHVEEEVEEEVENLYEHFGGRHVTHLMHTRYFHWTSPVVGAIIIASPLPDEMGFSLLGISRMRTYQFAGLSLFLNLLGIVFVLMISNWIRP